MDSGPFLAAGTSLWSEECNLASPFWEGQVFHDLSKVPELTLSEELTKALSRPNRMIVLSIAGAGALITSMATAIALAQSVQTAHFVYDLSRNVSMALHTMTDYVQL